MHGDEQAVRAILMVEGVDTTWRDIHGRTALSYAAASGKRGNVKALLSLSGDHKAQLGAQKLGVSGSKAVEVNLEDEYGRTPLSYAAAISGNENIVKALLAIEGIKVDLPDRNGRTPLSYAAGAFSLSDQNGRACNALKVLLSEAVNVNSKDREGRTPLHYAVLDGSKEKVTSLLGKGGIEVDLPDIFGRTPLSYAAARSLLVGYDMDSMHCMPVGHRPTSSDIVQALLDTKAVDVNSKDEDGLTPLSYAVTRSYTEQTVMILLRADGVNVDVPDHHGRTPLSYAIQHFGMNTVQALLGTTGLDINSQDRYGRTPLSYAAARGKEQVDALLAVDGIKVDLPDRKARTPLSYAAGCIYDDDCIHLGLRANDSLNKDQKSQTPQSKAAQCSCHTSSVPVLLATKAVDINSKDQEGRTPPFLCCRIRKRRQCECTPCC